MFTIAQRDTAWKSWPYPCIGQLRFLNLSLSSHPLYPQILSRLINDSQTILDAGCCFGQELRKLAFDGVPTKSIYGMDLEQSFLDLGFELFLDQAQMRDATFLSGNLLDDSQSFPQVEGKIDIINANSLFHLFTWEEQLKVAIRLASFLKSKPGSMILGRHVGAVDAGEYRGLNEGTTTYRHNVESFGLLFKEVSKRYGGLFKVDATLDMKDITAGVNQGQKWMDGDARRLHFVVTREESSSL